MRTLEQALIDHDLIVMRVIGEWWEQDLTGMDKVACAKLLAEGLATLDMPQEVQYLAPEETAAMRDLIAAGGRIPVPTFARTYGEVRQMGPGWLEREEPWFDPANVAESLWYRGFLYRGFDETAEGPIEFYFLPTEMMAQFGGTAVSTPTPSASSVLPPVTPPVEYSTAVLDSADDLTTILAIAQRYGLDANPLPQLTPHLMNSSTDRLSLLLTLAYELNFLRKGETGGKPTKTATASKAAVSKTAVSWLQQPRESQLRTLVEAWSGSNWNDLCHTPELACEGEGWQNDPILARTALLDALPRDDNWYALSDLVALIRENDPDFQRPDGNYDTWYIRDRAADAYISGFANWDLVEGRLLRFLLMGPLSWLGLVELANDDGGLFRLTERALAWLHNQPAAGHDVTVPIVVGADATVLVPYNADRYQRFQVARISDAAPYQPGKPYLYHFTPESLAQAQEQGISAERLLQFLQKVSTRPLPPSTKRAIERWAERGVEGVLETAVILRTRDAAILDTLSQNPKTRDYLGQRLGDLAVTIRRDQWQAFREATAQLGLLLDVDVLGD